MARSRSRSRHRSTSQPQKSLADEVEAFLKLEPGIEDRAASKLKDASEEVQRLVLRRGGLEGTRNPSAVLISRVRNAEEGLKPVMEKASDEVERFLAIENVEPHAAARLRRASHHVQQAAIARGSLAGTRDPSAVLMTRLRDAEREEQAMFGMPAAGDDNAAYAQQMAAYQQQYYGHLYPPPHMMQPGGYAPPPVGAWGAPSFFSPAPTPGAFFGAPAYPPHCGATCGFPQQQAMPALPCSGGPKEIDKDEL